MKKTKFKLSKIILITILVLLVIFIIFTLRKAMILSTIDKKVSDYENNKQNIYVKIVSTTSEYTLKAERYIKGDVDKLVMERKNKDGSELKVIQIDDATKHKLYHNRDGNKVFYENAFGEISPKPIRGSHIKAPDGAKSFASYTVLINVGYSDGLLPRILNSIVTSIKTVEVDGKKCYEVSSKYNHNLLYEQNTQKVLVYVEQDTDLAIKKVETFNENGKLIENITTYEYKFDEVTDENMKEPDLSEYKQIP